MLQGLILNPVSRGLRESVRFSFELFPFRSEVGPFRDPLIATNCLQEGESFAGTLVAMLLCAVTNRRLLGETEDVRRERLLAHAKAWAQGVDYIQIREKDLPLPELQALTAKIVSVVRAEGGKAKVLVNGPAQIALAAGADGVHLPADAGRPALTAAEQAWSKAIVRAAATASDASPVADEPFISVSCHSQDEIRQAYGASLLLFAPVFEKMTETKILRGQGLGALRDAVQTAADVPVLAMGGVTTENAKACIEAGAKGIAAIRLFLTDAWRALAEG